MGPGRVHTSHAAATTTRIAGDLIECHHKSLERVRGLRFRDKGHLPRRPIRGREKVERNGALR